MDDLVTVADAASVDADPDLAGSGLGEIALLGDEGLVGGLGDHRFHDLSLSRAWGRGVTREVPGTIGTMRGNR
jgi:hypothetical protein